MALLLILIGVVLIDVEGRGTGDQLTTLLGTDMPGFTKWGAAILILGAVGYVKPLRQMAHLGIFLIILVLLISNQGLFAKLQQAITSPPTPSTRESAVPAGDIQALEQPIPIAIQPSTTGSSTSGGALNAVETGASILTKFLPFI